MGLKFVQPYNHVVHATEETRRARYKGCVSRQTLRAQLRADARIEIDANYRGRDGKRGELHAVRRDMAQARARRDYRNIFGLLEPR